MRALGTHGRGRPATPLLRRDLAIPARFLLLRSLEMMSPVPPLGAALLSQFPTFFAQLPPRLRTFLRLCCRLSLRRKLRLLVLFLSEGDREDRRWSDGPGCCGKSNAHCGRGRLMFDAG